jgi:hypothetical protein
MARLGDEGAHGRAGWTAANHNDGTVVGKSHDGDSRESGSAAER